MGNIKPKDCQKPLGIGMQIHFSQCVGLLLPFTYAIPISQLYTTIPSFPHSNSYFMQFSLTDQSWTDHLSGSSLLSTGRIMALVEPTFCKLNHAILLQERESFPLLSAVFPNTNSILNHNLLETAIFNKCMHILLQVYWRKIPIGLSSLKVLAKFIYMTHP